jgi:pimeloyl-ACP methyl ester carboxylesterase
VTTFALVHGAYHGAACWARVVPELEATGHRAVAMDLPCDDPAAGVSEYADAVVRALDDAGADDDVIVVGHSLGGLTIPVVAARRPVGRLVFLAAVVPVPARTLTEGAETPAIDPEFVAAILDNGDGTASFREDAIARWFTHDAPVADAAWLAEGLRAQASTPMAKPSPLDNWPDVPTSYIVCGDDRIIPPDWQRRVARERLGVEPIELAAGHNPMVSRPAELAAALAGLA